jgi:hypothetical protein
LLDDRLAALTSDAGVVSAMAFHLDGTSDTYAFMIFERGACARRCAFVPFDQVVDATRPLFGDRTIITIAGAHGPVCLLDVNVAR